MKIIDEIIRFTGDVVTIEPNNGDKYTVAELQKYVGGYFEIFTVGDKYLICNEDGKVRGLPRNNKATKEYCTYLFGDDYFVGDVLIINKNHLD